MSSGDPRPRSRRATAPAAGLVAVLLTTGIVTRLLGIEAGLLSFLLAAVALQFAPHLYLPSYPPIDDEPVDDESVDVESVDDDENPDSDRSIR